MELIREAMKERPGGIGEGVCGGGGATGGGSVLK